MALSSHGLLSTYKKSGEKKKRHGGIPPEDMWLRGLVPVRLKGENFTILIF